jgi:hypothetical protein
MRITKQIATTVAHQLVLPKRQELKAEETKLSEIISKVYLSKIPEEVMVLFATQKKFFKVVGFLKINGNGFNFQGFPLIGSFPDNGDTYCKDFSVKECDLIKKQFDIVQKLKLEIEKLTFDIETALINYRTYNNIEKEFPEAFKLLPLRQTTALVINIKDIRCKLDKANC